MTKSEIRTRIAHLRPDFQPLETRSQTVLKNVQTLEPFRTAKTIGAYMPLPDEVDVTPFFQRLEKQFYIPVFDPALGSYRMAKYTPELKPGKFGIPEPEEPAWADADEIDLILVPGIAFDRTGNRLGRGGGFYDRLLPLYSAVRIALCFDFQTLDTIPSEPHDCRMNILVTETEVLEFPMNS